MLQEDTLNGSLKMTEAEEKMTLKEKQRLTKVEDDFSWFLRRRLDKKFGWNRLTHHDLAPLMDQFDDWLLDPTIRISNHLSDKALTSTFWIKISRNFFAHKDVLKHFNDGPTLMRGYPVMSIVAAMHNLFFFHQLHLDFRFQIQKFRVSTIQQKSITK